MRAAIAVLLLVLPGLLLPAGALLHVCRCSAAAAAADAAEPPCCATPPDAVPAATGCCCAPDPAPQDGGEGAPSARGVCSHCTWLSPADGPFEPTLPKVEQPALDAPPQLAAATVPADLPVRLAELQRGAGSRSPPGRARNLPLRI